MSRRQSFEEAAEELRQAWRILLGELAKSLGLVRLVDWFADKLTKEDVK